jgi:hypothetical protein
MAKVSPFHTDLQDHAASHREVYHDRDDCPDGGLLLPQWQKLRRYKRDRLVLRASSKIRDR